MVDQVVTEQHRERLAVHVLLRHRDRVAQAERILLADVVDRRHVADLLDLLQLVELPFGLQEVLELERAIEMVLERAIAATGDDQDVGESRAHRLLDHVLDRGRIDDREHRLLLSFRRREESRSESGSGDDGFPDRHDASLSRRVPLTGDGAPECMAFRRIGDRVLVHPSSLHVGSSFGSTSSRSPTAVPSDDGASPSMDAASSGPTNRSNSGRRRASRANPGPRIAVLLRSAPRDVPRARAHRRSQTIDRSRLGR